MRRLLIAIMVIACVGLGAGVFFIRMTSDRKGPEIKISEKKERIYTPGMKDKDILEGVTAVDDVDGDVSDSLIVENIYTRSMDEVVAILVAKDNKNNVTKQEYVMSTQQNENVAVGIELHAANEDGDKESENSSEEEAAEESYVEEEVPEEVPLTPQEEAEQRELAKLDSLDPAAPRFYLTTYYIEIPAGTGVEPLSYVKDIVDDADQTSDLYRVIRVDGGVDSSTPGTYQLVYTVTDSTGLVSNDATLTVVVV